MEAQFIELTAGNVAFLLIVGFIGGLVSGFIGSGGAFVLTPGMMSMGVSGVVAVASNLCHKFPKALVGARKRHKFGQVDVKLGLVMAASAAVGVWVGAGFMESVRRDYGEAGSQPVRERRLRRRADAGRAVRAARRAAGHAQRRRQR